MNVSVDLVSLFHIRVSPQFIILSVPNDFAFIFPHSLQVSESITPNVRPQTGLCLYFPVGHSLEEEMLSVQSNTTRIWFRYAGYIFRINELIRHPALYKISSKNKVMTCQFEYICFFFVFCMFC